MRERNNYPQNYSELGTTYSTLQPYLGNTKHMGGLRATKKLMELCCLNEGERILDVGCGTGRTSIYLAKKYGCKVVGVDISNRMVQKSKARAKREGFEQRVEFKMGDARNLLFEDNFFDVVICESVTALLEDKEKAISEYVRVVKPGGHVGLNELTWIEKPTTEMVKYASRIIGAEFSTSDGWGNLLNSLGLRNLEIRIYKINPFERMDERI